MCGGEERRGGGGEAEEEGRGGGRGGQRRSGFLVPCISSCHVVQPCLTHQPLPHARSPVKRRSPTVRGTIITFVFVVGYPISTPFTPMQSPVPVPCPSHVSFHKPREAAPLFPQSRQRTRVSFKLLVKHTACFDLQLATHDGGASVLFVSSVSSSLCCDVNQVVSLSPPLLLSPSLAPVLCSPLFPSFVSTNSFGHAAPCIA